MLLSPVAQETNIGAAVVREGRGLSQMAFSQ